MYYLDYDQVEKMQESMAIVGPILSYPEFLELQALHKSNDKKSSWPVRVQLLNAYAEALGLAGVEDHDMNALILAQYFKNQPDDVNIEEWNKLPYGDRMKVIGAMRINLFPEERKQYRRFIKQHIRPPRGSDHVGRIAAEENRHHPLAHLKALTGFEREHHVPSGISDKVYKVLDDFRFKKGTAGGKLTEDSPGPFLSSYTIRHVFLLYEKYGLVDPYEYYKDPLHYTLGVTNEKGVYTFLRWLQSTGYAFEPMFRSTAEYHNSQVAPDNHGEGDYYEFKAFNTSTASGNARQFKRGASIGHALLCYHREQRFVADRKKGMLTIDEKRLADIWQKYSGLVTAGFAQIGVTSLLIAHDPPMKEMTLLSRAVERALPDHWSRYNVNPSELPQEGVGIVVNGRTYPNIVSMSRLLLIDAHNEVEDVFGKAMVDFYKGLAYIVKNPNNKEKVRTFFGRFPCGIKYEKNMNLIYPAKIHELKNEYLTPEKIEKFKRKYKKYLEKAD